LKLSHAYNALLEGRGAVGRVPLEAVVRVRHEVARVFVKEQYRRLGVLPPVPYRDVRRA
jgi:hypothetical protein